MTELMKENKLVRIIDDMCNAFEDSQKEVGRLERENAQLKDQLRWRPLSEKPENAGLYFVEVKSYTGCEYKMITTAYFDGERFLWHDVVNWFPIPPAPEEKNE